MVTHAGLKYMKITILDGFTLNPGDNPWRAIEQFGDLTIYDRTPPDQVIKRAEGADIVITNKAVLTAETIGRLRDLKFIAVTATGFNVVDARAARARNIPVSNVPEYGTDSVAQHVFALMLSITNQPDKHDRAIREGQWKKSGDFAFCLQPLTELSGKTMGIVGFGKIGRRVGELASAFNMNVLAYSTNMRKPRPAYENFDWCTIEQVFIESDFVSLHCPLTDDNGQFVNASLLSKMKKTAVLINTARGGLVNEQDLADALSRNLIAAACLDVVSIEPIADNNPLLLAKNCLLTPHNAWATVSARRRLMEVTADNVEAFVGGRPINVVN